MVRLGFVIAWRFAGSPTLRSPPSTNATTEGCVTSFAVRDDYGVFALEDCDAGVGRAQVYTDYFTHDSKCFLVLFCFVICLGWMVSIIYRTNRVPEMFRGTRRGWRGFSDVCQY